MADRSRRAAHQELRGHLGRHDQARALQKSMGLLLDRSIEHLGSADLAVIQTKRVLLRAVRDLQAGVSPPSARNGARDRGTTYDGFNDEPDFGRLFEAHKEEVLART